MEFNPQLAGQDITPANLEFGTTSLRRRERREKSFSAASAFQGHQPLSFTGVNDESVPLVSQLTKNKNFRIHLFLSKILDQSISSI